MLRRRAAIVPIIAESATAARHKPDADDEKRP
jgi:hypothetical protein